MKKYSMDFGKKEKVLNYACQTYQLSKIGSSAFGIQIKPVTAKANFGSYSATERMKASFADFESKFGGKVFIVFSLDGEIANKEVIAEIEKEIALLG
jgi:hypothetical protein